MSVINNESKEQVNNIFTEEFWNRIRSNDYEWTEMKIIQMLEIMHKGIDEKRRSSYGIVYVVNNLCKDLYSRILKQKLDPYEIGLGMIRGFTGFRSVCVGFGVISHVGVKTPEKVWPVILEGADHELWEVKEFIQMFVRKMTKVHKDYVQSKLIESAQSDNPNYRRFASEALRPVVENRWIQDEPEFSLKVLRCLFKEQHEFPRVSVGNNLSDLSRKNPELIFGIVEELMRMNDDNSTFIAHRACRNLVKTDKKRVLDLLGVDEYVYKGKKYKR